MNKSHLFGRAGSFLLPISTNGEEQVSTWGAKKNDGEENAEGEKNLREGVVEESLVRSEEVGPRRRVRRNDGRQTTASVELLILEEGKWGAYRTGPERFGLPEERQRQITLGDDDTTVPQKERGSRVGCALKGSEGNGEHRKGAVRPGTGGYRPIRDRLAQWPIEVGDRSGKNIRKKGQVGSYLKKDVSRINPESGRGKKSKLREGSEPGRGRWTKSVERSTLI